MALIDIEGLSVAFGDMNVLDNIDLAIETGARVAILGGNGSGKTTLAHAIVNWETSAAGRAGAVRLGGRSSHEFSVAERARLVQYVGQVPAHQLSGRAFSVREEIAFGLENLLLPRAEIAARVERQLALARLTEFATRDPFTLSGGEQQRLVLAAALAMEPAVLILDEPLTNLDPEWRDAIVAVLAALPQDISLVLLDTDDDAAARLGCTRYRLAVGKLSPETESSLAVPKPLPLPPPPRASVSDSPRLLEVKALCFAYPGAPPLWGGLSFGVDRGEVLAVIGPNGAGKSTLVRLLNGLLKPASGQIRLRGRDTAGRRPEQLAPVVATVFQEPQDQIFEPTVRREIAFGPSQIRTSPAEIETCVTDALLRTGLTADAERHPLDLTHAGQRFVTIASALANTPQLLLLDEPQRGLDRPNTARLERILQEERTRGTAILMICHDTNFVARNATAALDLGDHEPQNARHRVEADREFR